MIEEKFKKPLMDFVSQACDIPNLVGIILFGSAVTGDVSKKSDIDLLLLFDCEHNPELGKESKTAIKIASEISQKYDMIHSFSFVMVNQRKMEEVEPDFLWNVCKEGILIWAKPEQIISKKPLPSLEPFVLISYSTKELSPKNKRTLLRQLFGYNKNKTGLVDKKREKLGPGTLFLKAPKLERLKKFFDTYGVKNYRIKKVWGH